MHPKKPVPQQIAMKPSNACAAHLADRRVLPVRCAAVARLRSLLLVARTGHRYRSTASLQTCRRTSLAVFRSHYLCCHNYCCDRPGTEVVHPAVEVDRSANSKVPMRLSRSILVELGCWISLIPIIAP